MAVRILTLPINNTFILVTCKSDRCRHRSTEALRLTRPMATPHSTDGDRAIGLAGDQDSSRICITVDIVYFQGHRGRAPYGANRRPTRTPPPQVTVRCSAHGRGTDARPHIVYFSPMSVYQ